MRTGPTGAVFLTAQALLSPVPPPAGAPPHQSAWHSPNSYLYGSLAVMFALISLSLVMLACSHFGNSNNRGEEGGSQKSMSTRQHHRAPYVEQFVVIMAGEANPSFLATQIPIRPGTSDAVETGKNGEKTDGATDGDEAEPH